MNTDVVGRVRNVPLPVSKPLLPLFEAVMNSIHAIEDSGRKDGRIDIEVHREPSLFSEEDRSSADVIGFEVKDNGVGFDEKNFEAFSTSDTTHKANRGGKGIGRFMWLAAFESVEIDSVFGTKGSTQFRKFAFCARKSGIENMTCVPVQSQEPVTIVRLNGFKEKFQKQCPKRLDTIAVFIVEEFLEYFIGPNPPVITMHDGDDSADLTEIFETGMVPRIDRANISIGGSSFELLHVRLYSNHITDHRLYLCAHGRAVVQEKLTGRIPNLLRRLQDEEQKDFVYAVYVNSPVLDESVNAHRTGFTLPEDSEGFLAPEITMAEIRSGVLAACKTFLGPYTAPIAQRKRNRVEKFVETDGAMYRPILNRLGNQIDAIDPEDSDDEIDRQLYAGYQVLQGKLRSEGQELLRTATNDEESFAEYEERFKSYFEKSSEINKSDLARYVCHRKAILDFLSRQLTLNDKQKYKTEDRIHSIIFPRGKTSDDVLFEEHNLWLIDERLAFHVFLSSDQPIKKAAVLESTSKKEPDIMVFDRTLALSENAEVPFSSITLIEFKKPQRDDYSENENPFVQIANYINEIRDGKAKTIEGRPIPVPPNLPFYSYIVCDVTPRLKTWAYHFELQETPDGLGFFGYKRHYNSYFELISYEKLVADAQKRNKAFFHHLGLPSGKRKI